MEPGGGIGVLGGGCWACVFLDLGTVTGACLSFENSTSSPLMMCAPFCMSA